MKYLLSSNPERLREALTLYSQTATVEAEYGDIVVEGSVLTLAHHGPRANQPCPCLFRVATEEMRLRLSGIEVIGLSHLDLDALGGCLAISEILPTVEGFWQLAGFVDTFGPHRILDFGPSPQNLARLNAFWAWSQGHRVQAPRDGSVLDITPQVEVAAFALGRILADDPELLAAGEVFRLAEAKLNLDSFVEVRQGVVVRIAPVFVNHLYTTPDGVVCRAVVAFNTVSGAVTVSFADPPAPGIPGAVQVVQAIWGPTAGGHAGIAGSPRGKRCSLADVLAAEDRVADSMGV
jgi:hypothetical protein